MRSSLFVASAASLMLIVPAFGQNLPPGMTMHRLQAGEPDASGWLTAASTEGGFSVRLPLKFNDFTLLEPDPTAPTLRTFHRGREVAGGHQVLRDPHRLSQGRRIRE